jgi:hypothetical protein
MPMLYGDLFKLAQIYQSECIKEAEYYRLVKQTTANEAGFQDWLLSKLGDFLICCGTKLKKRSTLSVTSGKL